MSLVDLEDTIVAIATPTSPSPRGVVRLTGPHCGAVLEQLVSDRDRPEGSVSDALAHWLRGRSARRSEVSLFLGDSLGRVPVDLMWWPTRRSYTAQPSAEIHTYGSLPVLTAIVRASIESGARAARPGEFTMRAFLAGRLDLTQAEAVLGVIDAEGRGSLDVALQQLAGNLSRPLEKARADVLNLLADVEAGLDFVDEDIEFIDNSTLAKRLHEIQFLLRSTSQSMQDREGGGDRPIIALRGEPNAGKSLLFNRLTARQAAIVSDVAGTTRDAVTCQTTIDGWDVVLTDTAGLENKPGEISQRSQTQGDRASQSAKVRLWCVDASRADFDLAVRTIQDAAARESKPAIIDLFVVTKCDKSERVVPSDWVVCSAVSGEGMNALTKRVAESLTQSDRQETGSVVGTAARCRHSLQQADQAANAALELIGREEGHELVATELREIARHIGEVTGVVYTDDLLDRVFSRFCIGK